MNRVRLKDIAEAIDYGLTASASEVPAGPKFLRITDIQNGTVNWNAVPYCNASLRQLKACQLRPGDIVFARTGATTGKSFLIRNCPDRSVFASYLIRVRPGRCVDPLYLSHFFDSQDYWRQIKAKTQGAAQPGVNSTKLKELEIPLPPIEVQRRIAAILDQADALRRVRQKAIKRLDQLGQVIFLEMFGDPTMNNRNLDVSPLGSLAEFMSGGTPSKNIEAYWGGDFPWVSPKDMKQLRIFDAEDHITERAFAETGIKKVSAGTPIIVVRGMILAHSVPMAMVMRDVAINQDMKAIRFNSTIHPEFGLWCLKAQHKGILSRVDTAAHGTKRLDTGTLKSLPVFTAPIEDQLEFVNRITSWDTQTSRYRRFLDESERLFSSLQHRAFQGEL